MLRTCVTPLCVWGSMTSNGACNVSFLFLAIFAYVVTVMAIFGIRCTALLRAVSVRCRPPSGLWHLPSVWPRVRGYYTYKWFQGQILTGIESGSRSIFARTTWDTRPCMVTGCDSAWESCPWYCFNGPLKLSWTYNDHRIRSMLQVLSRTPRIADCFQILVALLSHLRLCSLHNSVTSTSMMEHANRYRCCVTVFCYFASKRWSTHRKYA